MGNDETSLRFRLTGDLNHRGRLRLSSRLMSGLSQSESSHPLLWHNLVGNYLLSLLEHLPSRLHPFPLDRWNGPVRAWRLQQVSWWCG